MSFFKVRDYFNYENTFHRPKTYTRMFTTSILRCLKKSKTYKNISPIFKYLNFIFQIVTNFRSNSVLASSLKEHDYNNLAFEIHANKN